VFDDELGRLVVDMFATMYAAEGVGLAANQIGVDARVFVVDCPDASGRHTVAHVVNPVLEEPTDRELVTEPEGCLSVPGAYGDLARLATVAVQGVDRHGDPVRLVGTGLLARCFQHEVDHLDGIVYVDRLSRRERSRRLEEVRQPAHPTLARP
jgi:peptide deformylase